MEKINIKDDKIAREKVKALYFEAFPKEELMPWWLIRLINHRKGAEVCAYMDGDIFCGFTHTYAVDDMIFLLYFAVDDKIRGKGYGSKILTMLKEINPNKTITLNAEPLDENAENIEQRKKRLLFYKKNGFYDTSYMAKDIGGYFSVLSTNEKLDVETFTKLFSKLTFGLMQADVKKATT